MTASAAKPSPSWTAPATGSSPSQRSPTRASSPPLGGDGLLREVGAGLWYWAHRNPGPYLVSATMSQPVQLTVLDRPVTHSFGVPSIECADQVGLCTLDQSARTLERLAIPDVPDTRWATPTAQGCGLWGLAGVGANLRLVIQQRDGSFASADLPADPYSATMAEGGPNCEVAYYQSVTENKDQLVVSLDQGKTWQIRQTPLPQVAGYYEHQPRDRFLIPPHWADLPPMAHPLKPPGSPPPALTPPGDIHSLCRRPPGRVTVQAVQVVLAVRHETRQRVLPPAAGARSRPTSPCHEPPFCRRRGGRGSVGGSRSRAGFLDGSQCRSEVRGTGRG